MRTSMAHRFLAFDLGAESGRAVLGLLDRGKLETSEIHRFPTSRSACSAIFTGCLRPPRPDQAGPGPLRPRGGRSARGIGRGHLGRRFRTPRPRRQPPWSAALLSRLVDRRGDGGILQAGSAGGRLRGHRNPIPSFNTLFQVYAMVPDRSPLLEAASDLLFMPTSSPIS